MADDVSDGVAQSVVALIADRTKAVRARVLKTSERATF
jgi:hypothetical protein